MSDFFILDYLKETDDERFRKYIIAECRRMDRLDIYNWITNDELKIKQLQQENQQLKLDYELYKDNHSYKNYEVEIRDNTIKQLNEVIAEVREISNDLYNIIYNNKYEKFGLSREQYKDKFKNLLQILDKAKGEDNE